MRTLLINNSRNVETEDNGAKTIINIKSQSFGRIFSKDNLNDSFFLSNIRDIWLSYGLKSEQEMRILLKRKEPAAPPNQFNKEFEHQGFIIHKSDVENVDEKHMFEIQGDRRMKFMNIFFSVPEEFIKKIKTEIILKNRSPEKMSANLSMSQDTTNRISMSIDTFKNNSQIK